MRMIEEYKANEKLAPLLLPWLVCLTASLFFFYAFIQGNMFASIADNIMYDFNVQVDRMAYLSSIYYVANVIFLFVAGFIFDRYSPKKTILIAMLLCVLSTFILAQAQSFYLALFSRFVTGIGGAFCFLGPIRLASRWFPPKRMALVTGIIVTIAMTGGMIAQYPLAKLVAQVGWREALMQLGWLGILILIAMYFGIIDKDQTKNVNNTMNILSTARKAFFNLQTLGAALYTSLMNMAIAVYGAMMGSLYLVQKMNISKEEAAVVNSLLFLGAIIGGPIIGWCSDKLGLRILPMKVGVFASLLTLLSILFVPVSLPTMKVLFFLLGFFTAAQVISYALVVESNPLSMTASAVSVVSILTQAGYVIFQILFSFLLVQHGEMRILEGVPLYSLGDYQYAALIFPMGLMFALMVSFGLNETHCHQIED